MTATPATAMTRRHMLGLAAGALLLPGAARADAPRVAAIDWAAFETALALGVVPVAATELLQFRQIAVEPAVPETVADIGLRGTPNYEALRLAAPDLILTSNFYERQRGSLERIAPTLSLPVYEPGVPPYARAAQATLTLGERLGRTVEARSVLARADEEIAGLSHSLRSVARRPVFVISIGDARHVRAFGADSMFGDVLGRLGFTNAWDSGTRYAAAAPLGIETLARVPDASVIVVEPVPAEARWTLADSALWQALPMVRAKRVMSIAPVNHFGGLPAALRFARLAAAALSETGGGPRG